ncbi:hypothetical protein SeMB42_g05363 [Synchytrium endobioticum]|uniref:Uncharacterized protein n=1 Tax=Synchytrium endobioticum TaxID=286115 RepID=A0A507CFX0_9FUNG|nr:hypothetical protein SeLEV6574_g07968 [Synchytrium endobioticum]TPX41908.1 hypothetical protein SeMB42_g05363 [Synchytrium endobioticum]
MVKSFYINLVIILTALITTIGTASEWDDDAFTEATGKMIFSARDVVNHRRGAVKAFLGHEPADVKSHIITQIEKAVSKSIPSLSSFTEQELLQEPNATMRPSQVHFIRAYHSLVFERLKTLFLKIQHRLVKQQNSEILKTGLLWVAPYLLRHKDLERKLRERLIELFSENVIDRRVFGSWRKLELPVYDWESVRNIPLPTFYDDITGGMLEILRDRIRNVVRARTLIKRRGLPLNRQTDLDPTSYVIKFIAQIRSGSPLFLLTEQQLLENPNASMPPDQLQLTRAYHCLVFEELKTLFETIKNHFIAHENKGKLEEALAEVGRALKMHQNLESQYGEILERIQNKRIVKHKSLRLPEYDWPHLDRIIRMQSPPEDQNYAYNDEPISAHGPGCGLQASTSQPGPSVVARLKQPVLIDFLGVADTTVEATPELAHRFGHSHDDRDPLTDDRFSNELCRPPSDHVGFVGGGSMHPDSSTGNIKRPCDSSLHDHTSRSNIRVAGSPQKNTRVKLFGQWLDST